MYIHALLEYIQPNFHIGLPKLRSPLLFTPQLTSRLPSDESGVESTAGGKSHHPKKAVKARGRGRGAVKSRWGGVDGGGSDTSCSKEKDTSRDGRRTWTDAESDRLREVVEHRSGENLRNF